MRLLSQTSATSPHYSGSSRHISTLPHLSARSATSPLSHTSPHFPPHLHSPTPLRTFRHISTLPHLSALSATSPLSHTSPHFPPHPHSPPPLRTFLSTPTPPHLSARSPISPLPHPSAPSATSPLSHTSLRTFRYSHSPPNHPGRVSAAASPPRCEAGLGPRRKPPEEIGAVPPTSVRRRRSFPVRGVGRLQVARRCSLPLFCRSASGGIGPCGESARPACDRTQPGPPAPVVTAPTKGPSPGSTGYALPACDLPTRSPVRPIPSRDDSPTRSSDTAQETLLTPTVSDQ